MYLLPALLVLVLGFWGCGDDDPEEPAELASLHMLGDYGDKSPERIARDLELKPQRSFDDTFDLGTAYLWLGEYYKATEAYETAARQADDEDHLAVALYAKAVAAGYAGHLDVAVSTSDLLVRVRPESPEAAWLRLGLVSHLHDDRMGTAVAADHVMRLDPDASGHEVLAATTIIVVGAVVGTAIISGTLLGAVALVPPEDRSEVVVPMFEGLVRVGVSAMGVGSLVGGPSIGQKMVLEP